MTTRVTPPVVPDPCTPKMGGRIITGTAAINCWTGGKPKSDWSGLDAQNLGYSSPNQLRSLDTSTSAKAYNCRKKGPEVEPFKCGDNLVDCKRRIHDYFKDCGMDTIACLPDLADPNKMTNVITDHVRFTQKHATEQCKILHPLFDSCDRENDVGGKASFLATLESSLRSDVENKLEDGDGFAVTWLAFTAAVQPVTVSRFDKMKQNIKDANPAKCASQNLEELAKTFKHNAKELISAGQCDHNLNLVMLRSFLSADCDDATKHQLLTLQGQLERALVQIGFMEPAAATKYLSDEELDCKMVCSTAVDHCIKATAEDRWPPAVHAKDAKNPPADFGGAGTHGAHTLMHQGGYPPSSSNGNDSNGYGPRGPCCNCGGPHFKRDCPSLSGGKPKGGRSTASGRQNGNGTPAQQDSRSPKHRKGWQHRKDPGGTDTMMRNGKRCCWCLKCKRWVVSHTAETHTGGRGAGTPAQASNASASPTAHMALIQEPSTWNFALETGLKVLSICDMVFLSIWSWLAFAILGPAMISVLQVVIAASQASMGMGANLASSWLSSAYSALAGFIPMVLHSFTWCIGEYGWLSLAAPVLCLVLSAAIYWVKFYPPKDTVLADDDPQPVSRSAEHRMNHLMRKQHRKMGKTRTGSIRHHGFHRKHPTRLRSAGYFPPRAPALEAHRAIREREELLKRGYPHRPGKCHADGPKCIPPHRRRKVSPTRFPSEPTFNRPSRHNRHRHCGTGERNWCSATPNGHCDGPSPAPQLTESQLEAVHHLAFDVEISHAAGDKADTPLSIAKKWALRVTSSAPDKFRRSIPATDSFDIIWDSGASCSITFSKDDFVGELESVDKLTRLCGVCKGLDIAGHGLVSWNVPDASGGLRAITVPACCVPSSSVRLLSTTSLLSTHDDEYVCHDAKRMMLSGREDDPTRGEVTATVDPKNNLPTCSACRGNTACFAAAALNSVLSTIHADNMNLSNAEKELLKWHQCLGHMDFEKVKFLMHSGILANSEAARRLHTAACKLSSAPKCAACQFGKQRRCSAPGAKKTTIRDAAGSLKRGHLHPGQCVSVDHFVCSTKGRLFTSRGKSSPKDMCSGSCVFIDHASGACTCRVSMTPEHARNVQGKGKLRAPVP